MEETRDESATGLGASAQGDGSPEPVNEPDQAPTPETPSDPGDESEK